MAITTLDGYIASAKQMVPMCKTASRTTVGTKWFSTFDLTGNPGAGTLAGTSTTTGVVPTDATAGFPAVNTFGGSATGYLSSVDYGNSVACRIMIVDVLWKAGAYAYNASTTGQAPTSYSSRVPGGTDFSGTQLWYEQVTAGTGIQNVAVTYNDQTGASTSTGTFAIAAAGTVGALYQIPLAAGRIGVQGVTGVVGSVATAGTFNILVVRPLWTGRVKIANDGDTHGLDKTGMPQVFAHCALSMFVAADSTSTGVPEIQLEVCNG
jgi:hypothetical protein